MSYTKPNATSPEPAGGVPQHSAVDRSLLHALEAIAADTQAAFEVDPSTLDAQRSDPIAFTWPIRTPRTDAAARYAESNFDAPLSLQAAACQCHMSKFEFSRAFKREHGVSFVEFVLRLRARKAAELLRSGSVTVKQVAFAVGFNDLSYFGRMFRRYYGEAPSHYLDRQRTLRAAITGADEQLYA